MDLLPPARCQCFNCTTNEQLRLGQSQTKTRIGSFSRVFGPPTGKGLSPLFLLSLEEIFRLIDQKKFRPAYAAWLKGKIEEASFRLANERIALVNSILL
jgi:hypothetical protein